MNRRNFISSILAAAVPPAYVRGGHGILMPVQKVLIGVYGTAFCYESFEEACKFPLAIDRYTDDATRHIQNIAGVPRDYPVSLGPWRLEEYRGTVREDQFPVRWMVTNRAKVYR